MNANHALGHGTLEPIETRLIDHVKIPARFHRSVRIVDDGEGSGILDGYLITPFVRQLAETIVSGAIEENARGAWSLVGPYGTGKSAFVLFLLDILSRPISMLPDAQKIRDDHQLGDRIWHPISIIGQRSSFRDSILTAFKDHLPQSSSIDGENATELQSESTNELDILDKLLKQLLGVHGQVIVIIDEFGKFLEQSVADPEASDLMFLQFLAERASRSDGHFVLMTIQHSSFSSYAEQAGVVAVNEWKKIQGRFDDLSFLPPSDQVLLLTSAAIVQNFPPTVTTWFEERWNSIRPNMDDVDNARFELLKSATPIHPVAQLIMWPLFRSTLAQNERSLFAFLCSHEEHAFSGFLGRTKTDVSDQTFDGFYRIDQLYDYITASLGTGIYTSRYSAKFAEALNAIERLDPTAPPCADRIIKATLLLQLFGDSVGLAPTEAMLRLTLFDGESTQQHEFEEALDYLKDASLLVFRTHRNSYAIWEGSDVDVSAIVETARANVEGEPLGRLLDESIFCPPIIARRHYLRTGTLRHFQRIVNAESPDFAWSTIERTITDSAADGYVVNYIATTKDFRQQFLKLTQELLANGKQDNARPILVGISNASSDLEPALRDLAAVNLARRREPKLASDATARKEVNLRFQAAMERVEFALGSLLGLSGFEFKPQESDWHAVSGSVLFQNGLHFQQYLSDVLDSTYSSAPEIKNELINRATLSSAAAKARRNLMQGMLEHERQFAFGITGHPPEMSMYRSLFEKSGMHRNDGETYRLAAPSNKSWIPFWSAMERLAEDSADTPLAVDSLLMSFSKPPFGMRAGLLPVTLLAFLIIHRNEVAIYESGTFVPELRIEVFEKLLKRPSDFAIRRMKIDQASVQLLNDIHIAFSGNPDSNPNLIEVVRPLVRTVAQLPPFSRQTRRFSDPRVISVREAILRAQDPIELLYSTLPRILGDPSIANPALDSKIAHNLESAISKLQSAFPLLVDEVHDAIFNAFALKSSDPREELRARMDPLVVFAYNSRLKTFLLETQRTTSNWAVGLGRAVLDGLPMEQWKDSDLTTFHARLTLMSRELIQMESLVGSPVKEGSGGILRVSVLAKQHMQTTVPFDTAIIECDEVVTTLNELRAILDRAVQNSENGRRLKTNLLAQLLLETSASEATEEVEPNHA